MDIREYAVEGMTCHHCAESVKAQVGRVEGVQVASVNLDLGLLTVAGEGVDDEAVRGAVVEAGYAVA
jgi:copper chaperone